MEMVEAGPRDGARDRPLVGANNDRSQRHGRGGGYTMGMVMEEDSSCAAALAANGQSPCAATATAVVPLLL
jgi:hypothetical protein